MGRFPGLGSYNPLQLLLMAGLGSRLRSIFRERRGQTSERGENRPAILSETFPPLPQPAHTAPRIVSVIPGPPPPPELERPPEPQVVSEAPEGEDERKEKEDLVREVIHSTTMMLLALEEAGHDASLARRHLSLAESLLHQRNPERALKYATKAMELAESLEAEEDRCPGCGVKTKPRWIICPKCGAPLREQRPHIQGKE